MEKIKGFVAEYYTLTVDKKNFEVKAVKTSHDYKELRTLERRLKKKQCICPILEMEQKLRVIVSTSWHPLI